MTREMKKHCWAAAGAVVTCAAGLALVVLGPSGCSTHKTDAQEQARKQPAASAGNAEAGKPVRVKAVRLTREHLKRVSTPQPAQIGAYEKTDIYARVSGYLDSFGALQGADGKKRPLDIGDRVAKGQVLARLAVPEMEQERLQKTALLDQAQAGVAQAEASLHAATAMVDAAKAELEESNAHVARYEAELAFRKVEYERYLALVKERAVRQELAEEKLNLYRAAESAHRASRAALASDQANVVVEQAKLAKARADVTAARARSSVAQANLEYADIMLSYATIKAPYEGVITRRLFDTGAFVQSAAIGKSEPLFTLARIDRLRIIADIPETECGLLQLGQTAALNVTALRGQPLSARIVRFADALDSGTRTMRTEAELDAPIKGLRPGMFGSITIVFADVPDALMLPASAILSEGGTPAVLIIEDGKARRRAIEVGANDGGRVQVIQGLSGGELVVVDGAGSLRDGMPVEVAP